MSQQGMSPAGQPMQPPPGGWPQQAGTSSTPGDGRPATPSKPPGRGWWIGCAVLHALCAASFGGAIWECVQWLQYVNTDAYVAGHRDDADLMLLYELGAVGLAVMLGCAVVYAVIGLIMTLVGRQSGPVMLMIGAVPAGTAASAAASAFAGDAVALLFGWGSIGVLVAGLAVGAIALGHRQRPPRRGPTVMPVPPPYRGGSPYLRPPGA